jgi:hypothetical protein
MDPVRSMRELILFTGCMQNISDDENWLFLGDLNFYKSLEDRNKLVAIYKIADF